MRLIVKSNIDQFKEALKRKVLKFNDSLSKNIDRALIFFTADIIKNQMTGQSGNRYLNRRTGTLARSAFEEHKIEDRRITMRAGFKAPYAIYHEGKRLSVEDRWKTLGQKLIAEALDKSAKALK